MSKKRQPSLAMRTTSLQSATDFCAKCTYIEIDTNSLVDLADSRGECQYCRTCGNGIFKFDAIYTALAVQKLAERLQKELDEKDVRLKAFKGKGKTATVDERYGTAIKSLRAEGKSQRIIAKITGLSPTTINKYLKSLHLKD